MQASRKLHGSRIEGKVVFPGSQFCVQQYGSVVKQVGTLYISPFTGRFASRDVDDATEGVSRRQIFFPSDVGRFLKAPN